MQRAAPRAKEQRMTAGWTRAKTPSSSMAARAASNAAGTSDDGFNVRCVQAIQDVQGALAGDHIGALHTMGHQRINNHLPG